MPNVSSGRLSNSMNQYQLPTGIWPPTSLPQQPNAPQPLPFGLIPGTNVHHAHIARGSSATPAVAAGHGESTAQRKRALEPTLAKLDSSFCRGLSLFTAGTEPEPSVSTTISERPKSQSVVPTSSTNTVYTSGRRQATMNHTGTLEEAETRRVQLLRGTLQSRYVVSKAALQSLQAVNVKDLPESDRTCMICYNDYETVSPEGVSEMPIRLPKCKHVFGNHCIRKWFQDSDSCPYCRDKLQSEPKHYPSSTRAFLDMMRIRGWSAGSEVAEDFYRRIMNGEDVQAIVRLARPATERHPAQDEQHEESSRRSRNRRASSSSVEQEPFSPLRSPEMTGHGATRPQTTPNSSGAVSPTQAGAGSTPWIVMGPGSTGDMQQNVPFRYQSPARPGPSTTARQPSLAAQPSSRHQQAYTRHAASSSAIPNPLRQGNQASQILHLHSPDRPLDDLLEAFYSSGDESA
ncbi:hypothetical protein NLG97_g6037 [Lecanicillium saksenae]|uniref:Uncharacterized protein n=1 Tax=Lecanicillium saksenae TaxID=468837 RepID=A0ACC1QSF0_9HYPO|nr:hypothetical protein NLG97_g6037 [Lecanicillium saksenae]